MAPVTHFIAVPFLRPEDGGDIFIGEPKQAGSADSAIRMAGLLAVLDGYCGAGAFMRTDDPASGQIVEAQTLRTFGEVDVRLLCS